MGARQSLPDDDDARLPPPTTHPLANVDSLDDEHPLYWTTPRRAPTDLSAIHSPSARRMRERWQQRQQRAAVHSHDDAEKLGTEARLFFRSSTMWTGASANGGGGDRDIGVARRHHYRQQQQEQQERKQERELPARRQRPDAAPAKGERRAGGGGGPLPRQLLNIHNHRPRSAADYGLMASAFLSGEARANGDSSSKNGGRDDDRGLAAALGRVDSSRVGADAHSAAAAEDDWRAKHVGTQCDLMSEVVLKFNNNKLQGAVELSSLHDILRRFAAVAHPLVGADDNGSSPLLQRVAAAGGGGPLGMRLHAAATDSDVTSTLPASAGGGGGGGGGSLYAAAMRSSGFDIPFGGGGVYIYADSVATESSAYCRLSTESAGGGAAMAIASQSDSFDWPDRGGGQPVARSPHDRTVARVAAGPAAAAAAPAATAASAGGFRSAESVTAARLPPVDYHLGATTSAAADAATVPSVAAAAASASTAVTNSHTSAAVAVDFARAREHLLKTLKVKSPAVARDVSSGSDAGFGGRREAKVQATSCDVAVSAADALGGAVRDAEDAPSQQSSADITTSARDEDIIAGVGLGYRMSWRHANDAYNVLIPRPRVVQETISASTVSTERSTTPEVEDADFVDIRL